MAVAVAIRWGAFVAGGSDSYCYVAQASMWVDGSTVQPLSAGFQPSWRSRVAVARAGGVHSIDNDRRWPGADLSARIRTPDGWCRGTVRC